MHFQPPISIVAARAQDSLKQTSHIFVQDGAASMTPDERAAHQRKIETCGDGIIRTYCQYEAMTQKAHRLGTMLPDYDVSQAAWADLLFAD
jgi:hypothetical protein